MSAGVGSWECALCDAGGSSDDSYGEVQTHYRAAHYVAPKWADFTLTRVSTPTPMAHTAIDRAAVLSGKRRSSSSDYAAAKADRLARGADAL